MIEGELLYIESLSKLLMIPFFLSGKSSLLIPYQ